MENLDYEKANKEIQEAASDLINSLDSPYLLEKEYLNTIYTNCFKLYQKVLLLFQNISSSNKEYLHKELITLEKAENDLGNILENFDDIVEKTRTRLEEKL